MSPTAAFVARIQKAFPEAPGRLTYEVEEEQLDALSGFFDRVSDVKRRAREGTLDRSALPPRVGARGAAAHLVELSEAEQESVWLILTAAAPLVAQQAQHAPGVTRELLADADSALLYCLTGYDPDGGASLLTWLRSDMTESFKRLDCSPSDSERELMTTSTMVTERYVDPNSTLSTRPLSELAEPAKWARTLTRGTDLEELWSAYLSPEAEGYD